MNRQAKCGLCFLLWVFLSCKPDIFLLRKRNLSLLGQTRPTVWISRPCHSPQESDINILMCTLGTFLSSSIPVSVDEANSLLVTPGM